MITFEELQKNITQNKWAPIYLLTGEEDFYIDVLTKELEERILPPEERDMNQILIYGRDSSVSEIVNLCKEYPFGATHKVIIVKEAKDLKKIETIAEFLPYLNTTTILILVYKHAKAPAALIKAIEKHQGIVFLSEKVKDWDLNKWVKQRVEYHKLKIEDQQAAIISEHIGNELSRIESEIEKLKIILPENSLITADIIEKHISISKEYNVFELQDAIGTQNIQKAYKIVGYFVQNPKDNPNVKILPMLHGFFYKMLRFHYLAHKTQDELFKLYNTKSSFMVNKQTAYAHRYPPQKIHRIFSDLRTYDLKSKGFENIAEDGELLKELIFKVMH